MLIRILLCCLTVSILLVSCSNEGETPPVAAPADRQSQQSATQQQLQQQQQTDASAPGQEQPVLEQQQAEREESQSLSDEPQVQPESRPRSPGGPPEPEFDFSIATDYLRRLVEEVGPRASGTEEERAAADWLAEEFEKLGYRVEIQDFDYRSRVSFSRIDIPDDRSLFGFRFPNSSEQAVSGPLVEVVGVGTESDFAAVDVAGAIAVVNRGMIEFSAKAANAQAAGAVALIVVNSSQDESLSGTLGAIPSDIPVLLMRSDDRFLLRQQEGSTLEVPEAQPLASSSQNVIARRSDTPCQVVVGGHYDTVPGVDGANDNASGTALTVALSATWADHPASADICFVGFGAEELGLHGSRRFVQDLVQTGEIASLTAMLNLDAIGDGRKPYRIVASPTLRSMSNLVAAELQIAGASGDLPTSFGSDHASFASAEIPVIFVFPPGAILHTPLDNLDNVDLELFEDIARLNHGILACLLQRAGSPISPSISCGEEEPQSSSRATLEE